MDGSQRDLSIRLYEALEEIGASEEMRHIHIQSVVGEIIESLSSTFITKILVSTYVCGSWCEGTTTPEMGSDIDMLYVPDIPVNIDINEADRGVSYLMVQDHDTQPGYFKLQLVYDRVPLTVYMMEVPPNYDTDRQGRMCMKHLVQQGMEIHGPANSLALGNGIMKDNVAAYRCTRIPDGYTEWVHRRRNHGFPSKELIDRMVKLSCFVVGTGHESSVEQNIEWRLSFSLQERELMLSLNPVQHKSYILLKMIKKEIIQPYIGEVDAVSSYHCKTCLLYAIENSPPDIWTRDNLVHCVFRCLNVLYECVQSGNCPNYFMPNSNMFNREIFREKRRHVLQVLDEILSVWPNMLIRLKVYKNGNIIARGMMFDKTNVLAFRYNFYMFFLNEIFFFTSILLRNSFTHNSSYQTIQFLLQLLNYLQTMTCLRDHTENQTKEAISYIIPWVHQRLAISLASKALQIHHEGTARLLLSRSNHHFLKSMATDLMNTHLMYVTVLYKLGKYKQCEEILEKLDLKLKKQTASNCCCSDGLNYSRNNKDLIHHITDKKLSIKETLYSEVVSCITFLPQEVNIVPSPLQYEMRRSENTPPGSRDKKTEYWFDWAVVDAKVLLFFMQYLVFTKLDYKENKEVAIQNLEWVMAGDIIHRDTAYNLLGWIHLQEHRLEEAVRCWRTSLAIRSLHNAAKFHISELMLNIHTAFNG